MKKTFVIFLLLLLSFVLFFGLLCYFVNFRRLPSRDLGIEYSGVSESTYFNDYLDLIGPNVHSTEYKCHGKCSCDSYFRRSATISRGVTLFVTSISSILAYKLASDRIRDDCIHQFSPDSCPKHAILSEIEDCEASESGNSEDQIEDTKTGRKLTFFCKGKCVPLEYPQVDQLAEDVGSELDRATNVLSNAVSGMEEMYFRCDTLSLSQKVVVEWEMIQKMFISDPEFAENRISEIAKQLFLENQLDPYCQEKSAMPASDFTSAFSKDDDEYDESGKSGGAKIRSFSHEKELKKEDEKNDKYFTDEKLIPFCKGFRGLEGNQYISPKTGKLVIKERVNESVNCLSVL